MLQVTYIRNMFVGILYIEAPASKQIRVASVSEQDKNHATHKIEAINYYHAAKICVCSCVVLYSNILLISNYVYCVCVC